MAFTKALTVLSLFCVSGGLSLQRPLIASRGLGGAAGLWRPSAAQRVERLPALMDAAGGASEPTYYQGARVGPPPDLPSLLLHNRIVYVGMPLVAAVTELVIAQLLYLNYEDSKRPITLYINSPGTVTPDGRMAGFETEAFAIADTMKYIKPPVHTVAVGQAFGSAAMLLAQGEKGHRMALPNASIMLMQPRSMARGQASDIAIKAKEVLANRKVTADLLATACGKPPEQVLQDIQRIRYMSPEEAIEYGIIDRVLEPKDRKAAPSFIDKMLSSSD